MSITECGIIDKRSDLQRLTRHRDNAVRSCHEIAEAAWEVIRVYGNRYNLDANGDPICNLLIKVAVWENPDDSPPLVFDDGDGSMPYISLKGYEGDDQ